MLSPINVSKLPVVFSQPNQILPIFYKNFAKCSLHSGRVAAAVYFSQVIEMKVALQVHCKKSQTTEIMAIFLTHVAQNQDWIKLCYF